MKTLQNQCSRKPIRAFTLTEVLLVAVGCFLCIVLFITFTQQTTCGSRQLKCSTQVRGIMQGMVVWAQSDNDRFPIPSRIDAANDTIALGAGEPPESKDTTANIMSILLFSGYFPTEMLVTPAEANGHIRPFERYMFSAPPAAIKPSAALWDPAFNADFTGKAPAGLSYAHAFPLNSGPGGKPRSRWSNGTLDNEAVVGNRGPLISGVNTSGRTPRANIANPNSNTFLIHGSRTTWEGNIGFNDNHVDFFTSLFPVKQSYTDVKGARRADCLFFDEGDAVQSQNNYLGIFTKAGASRKDFRPIWD